MKKILSIVLAIVMMLSMITPVFASNFEDIEENDYKIQIERLVALGIVNGKTATEFDPDGIVTRAEMAKLLVVSLGLKTGATILENSVTFTDTEGHWAIGYINVAAQYGLIKGDGDGNFRPNDTVNYAEAVTMCLRALNYARVIDKTGEWPTNYLNKALELRLFDDVEFANAKDGANRGSIAGIVWNMLEAPMWVITEESEADGIYYGKTGETMLELKFPDYTVDEYTFNGWAIDVEKDEYVVTVDLGGDNFEYASNDFYTFVPGTVVEALTKDDDCISMYATDDNYLAEGTAKELADKFDNFTSACDIDSYEYLLLSSAKKTATINDNVAIHFCDNEIVEEVKDGSTNLKVKVSDIDGTESTYTIDDDEGIESEDASLLLIDGERATMADLKEGDIVTWVNDDLGLVSRKSVKGEFEAVSYEVDEDGATIIITVDGKKYDLPMVDVDTFATVVNEMDDEDEVEVNVTDLTAKVKDNKYIGENVTLFFDCNGFVVKALFGEVEEISNNASLYLAVGNQWAADSEDGEIFKVKLANADGTKTYTFEEDKEVDLTAGSVYWVEFNNNDEIEAVTEISELGFTQSVADSIENLVEAFDDDKYIVANVEEELDTDTNYVGDAKITSSTIVFTINQVENDDEELLNKFELSVTTGPDALEGIDDVVIISEEGTIKASYAIVCGDAESADKTAGIVEKFTEKLGIDYVTISGKEYELDANTVDAHVGDVVAFTENDGEVKLVFKYEVAELARAGKVTKVEDELFAINNGELNNDLDTLKDEFEDNDVRIFKISVEYKNGAPKFADVEEIEIDSIKLAKGNYVALNANYVAIIDGFEGVE